MQDTINYIYIYMSIYVYIYTTQFHQTQPLKK